MKIAIAGHTGRVGKELQDLIKSSENIVTAGWASEGPLMFSQSKSSSWNPDEIDIVIDFSLPENFSKLLTWCQTHNKPMVSGVTGLGEITSNSLKDIMGPEFEFKAPVFWSSNMSLGIALLKQFIEMAKFFNPHEFHISETHHVQKKDSPSGTALSLAFKIENTFGLKQKVNIEAFRKEEVFGIHEVTFKSDDEIISIYHEAKNRRVFASGALKVAQWMFDSSLEPKLHFMEDFIQDVKNT